MFPDLRNTASPPCNRAIIRESEAGRIRVTQHGSARDWRLWCAEHVRAQYCPVNEMKLTDFWDKIDNMIEAEIVAKNGPEVTPNYQCRKRTSPSAGKRTSGG